MPHQWKSARPVIEHVFMPSPSPIMDMLRNCHSIKEHKYGEVLRDGLLSDKSNRQGPFSSEKTCVAWLESETDPKPARVGGCTYLHKGKQQHKKKSSKDLMANVAEETRWEGSCRVLVFTQNLKVQGNKTRTKGRRAYILGRRVSFSAWPLQGSHKQTPTG